MAPIDPDFDRVDYARRGDACLEGERARADKGETNRGSPVWRGSQVVPGCVSGFLRVDFGPHLSR